MALYGIQDFVPIEQSQLQVRIINDTTNFFQSSTDVFREMITTGYLNTSFHFFAGPGLFPCISTNSEDFTAENNAWCLVAVPRARVFPDTELG